MNDRSIKNGWWLLTILFLKVSSLIGQEAGTQAYKFRLTDTSNRIVKLEDFAGKVLIIDFWYTGCSGCAHYFKTSLSQVEHEFIGNKQVRFMSVSIDKDREKWLKGVNSGVYTSSFVTNVYTNGEGKFNAFKTYYNIKTYPQLLIIDQKSRVVDILKYPYQLSSAELISKIQDLIQ